MGEAEGKLRGRDGAPAEKKPIGRLVWPQVITISLDRAEAAATESVDLHGDLLTVGRVRGENVRLLSCNEAMTCRGERLVSS